jgi:hypothetical protein
LNGVAVNDDNNNKVF